MLSFTLSQNSIVFATNSLGVNMGGQVGSCIQPQPAFTTQLNFIVTAVGKAEC